MRKRLWARSIIRAKAVRVYLNTHMPGEDGCCYVARDGSIVIEIRAALWKHDSAFQETLLHEVCHAIEAAYFPDSVTQFGGGQYDQTRVCSEAVQSLGRGLRQFLQNLRCVKKQPEDFPVRGLAMLARRPKALPR